MKDSKGRLYDGWVVTYEDGNIWPASFRTTRSEIRREWDFPWIRKLKLTKVRMMEVE